MLYTVALRFDAAGTSLCILHDDEPLPGGDGVRYRLVAKTDDQAEAVAVADLLRKQINAGELQESRRAGPRRAAGPVVASDQLRR